ncbi:threonine/serine ThrE exporter family protein [Corallincola spongiicola]|uniref:Threonine/serine exporter n=1 Tax=Corallincola spongiicola TaxID=2520508 RepID=A0ABY1WNF7_9GAMM|nr:threonine/serine exporter family protein [Corallincola spongiicola]TAA45080.1 threonine/serine exporter [Corallincola spongiicola]
MSASNNKPQLSLEQHEEATRLSLWGGQLLLQYGAESQLVETLTHRLGTALGCDWMDLAVSHNAIVLTSVSGPRYLTKTRRIVDRGINMTTVSQICRLVVMVEKGLKDARDVRQKLRELSDKQFHYNRWLMVVMVGLSCACFARLQGGDWPVFCVTFMASAVAMFVRQELHHRGYHLLMNWVLSAAAATAVASLGPAFSLGNKPELAMAASVLLLVPGFPLMNAISDMVKGHVNVGIARWTWASMMTLSVALGILLAMNLTGVWGWL